VRERGFLVLGAALIGFVVVLALRAKPADPESRLPERFRLAGLINREQRTTAALRTEVEQLRRDVDAARDAASGQQTDTAALDQRLDDLRLHAGLVGLRGRGLRVTLDDSTLKQSPSGNVNDLVIHSQDVQAVVNALWRSGAEAISLNGERLVATSAVLCVGNTLLLNGTVLSPPFVAVAIGADRDRFEADALVRRLHRDATSFGLRFSVSGVNDASVPAYDGAVNLRHAEVSS
jgi:uncharacterized protein YlxW (UPF0749 family)